MKRRSKTRRPDRGARVQHPEGCVCEACFEAAVADLEVRFRERRESEQRVAAATAAIEALTDIEREEIRTRFFEPAPETDDLSDLLAKVDAAEPEPVRGAARRARVAELVRAKVQPVAPTVDGVLSGWTEIANVVRVGEQGCRRMNVLADPLPFESHGKGQAPTLVVAAFEAWAARNEERLRKARSISGPPCGNCGLYGHRAGSQRCRGARPAVTETAAADADDEPEPAAAPREIAPPVDVGAEVRWFDARLDRRVDGVVRENYADGRALVTETVIPGGTYGAGPNGGTTETEAVTRDHVVDRSLLQVLPGAQVVGALRKDGRARRDMKRSITVPQKVTGGCKSPSFAKPGAMAAKLDVEVDYPDDVERPRSRADCRDGERPCPWVTCKHHLYLDVNPHHGSIKLNFPELEPWDLRETCALDVAERGGATLEEVGDLVNLTRERTRQIEVKGLIRLRLGLPEDAEEAFRDILARKAESDAARPENADGGYDGHSIRWGKAEETPAQEAQPNPVAGGEAAEAVEG